MLQSNSKKIASEILQKANIKIDGSNPWDIQIHDDRMYSQVLQKGSLGLGETYMSGWWDVSSLDLFFERIIFADLSHHIINDKKLLLQILSNRLMNSGTKKKSLQVATTHYDLGNDLYEVMLDPTMTYTCGYWSSAKTLKDAQDAKHDLICKKLNLKKGQKILDIGCGFGSFAMYASVQYQVSVLGITISKEQIEYGKKKCKGLDVQFKFQDYRDISGKYDHIVSIGMYEHVGHRQYKQFMKIAHEHLKDEGLFLLHTIGANDQNSTTEEWINKYIFPNSQLPTITEIGKAIEGLFVMEDWQNFGADYEKTLLTWWQNFDRDYPKIKNEYDERFYRMWKYYLMMCAASFRVRKNQLWQIVLSKNGVKGGYNSIR
jgi:cyclopropane-fatty-acyl-phospholipid synthase